MGRILLRWVVLPMVAAILLFFVRLGCGLWRLSHSDVPSESERAIEEPYREAADGFAKALQDKNYRDAYARLTPALRRQATEAQFAEPFRGAWIQSYHVRPVSKDLSGDVFIPRELKPQIREVVAIDLNGPDIDAVIVLYFVDENGEARVARLLID